jgi:hypothetical protein
MKRKASSWMLVIVAVGLLLLSMSNVIFQEGNPLPIFSGIMKLQGPDKEYAVISNKGGTGKYLSRNSGEERYAPVINFMENRSWRFKEQLGAGLVFQKADKQKVIETRLYSRYFYIWEIQDTDQLE